LKKVLVIGCNGGIGKAICFSISKAGYFIIGADKDASEEQTPINEFYPVDLISAEKVSELCKLLKSKGELWGIVFAAGIYPVRKFEDYSLELWDEVMNVNLKSSFLIAQSLQNQITEGGRMIFISSGASYLGSKDIGYSVSKAGILGLTNGLAKIFRDKILVNTICPGVIESKMSAQMDESRKESTIQETLLKRIGQPEEISSAIVFLLSPENSYMTGSTIDINGGLYSR